MKHFIVSTFTLLFILCAFSQFYADDSEFFSYYVTPDVWIILDTSGSMTWDMEGCRTYGDGSEGYEGRDTDGDALPNDARMYAIKNGLYGLVSDPEISIRWGLATFYQNDYWGNINTEYYREADSFPPPTSEWCTSWPSGLPYTQQEIWWHYTSRPYAYEAFFERVPMAEGSPSHINEILRWIDNVSGSAPKKE
ncbi:unnamed protein product, partial [marine sediment metagenome]